MSENGDINSPNWVMYRDRPDWKDIESIPQDDGPDPVVSIAYSERFEDVYNYFRAVLKRNEKSQRALELTKDAVELNAANYTVWQYRRDLLKSLGTNLEQELEYVEEVIENSPKNYQVWHHRRVLIEWTKDPKDELKLTSSVLSQDAKNYHAWQHRQWVIKTFGLYDDELEFIETLLDDDVRNNSAWNQRYFVINNHVGWPDYIVQREIGYAINKIKFIKNNESSWNYLRGVLLHDKRGMSGNSVVSSFCEDLYKSKNRSPYLLGFIVDICDEALKKGNGNVFHNADRAIGLCKDLAEKHDKIRCKYWNYISNRFKEWKIKKEEEKNGTNEGDKPVIHEVNLLLNETNTK